MPDAKAIEAAALARRKSSVADRRKNRGQIIVVPGKLVNLVVK